MRVPLTLCTNSRRGMLSAALLLLASLAASAQDLSFKQITQLPFGFGMFEPSISADGSRVAFRTTANLTGSNPDGNFEVFVYDAATDSHIQITNTPTGIGNFVPMITPDGAYVVFRSVFDFTGEGNADTFELWEADIDAGTFRQVTNNPASTPVFDPRISGDGNYLTFLARINPTGGNPDGSLEVFRINRVTGSLVQISNNTTVAAQFPDINGDGSRIVWGDRANYDGTNGNGGLEIWVWDEAAGTITAVTNQSASVLETNLPRIDHAGRYVSFVSLFDFSGAGAIGRKVFVTDSHTGAIQRVTSQGVSGSGADYPDAEISPDGSTVYFESNINLVGTNADGNRELFAFDVQSGVVRQVTNTSGGVSIIALSDDATRRYLDVSANGKIAYRSDQDLDPNVSNSLANLDLFIGSPPCAADYNGDTEFDVLDFLDFFDDFGTCNQLPGPCGTVGNADYNGDTIVDVADFLDYLHIFGTGCN